MINMAAIISIIIYSYIDVVINTIINLCINIYCIKFDEFDIHKNTVQFSKPLFYFTLISKCILSIFKKCAIEQVLNKRQKPSGIFFNFSHQVSISFKSILDYHKSDEFSPFLHLNTKISLYISVCSQS